MLGVPVRNVKEFRQQALAEPADQAKPMDKVERTELRLGSMEPLEPNVR